MSANLPFILSFGLVIVAGILSLASAIIFGGFKFGSLEKRIALALTPAEKDEFVQRFHRRIAELGFQPGGVEGQFVQGFVGIEGGLAFTHAKTKKQMTLAWQDNIPKGCTVELALRYLDPIVGDTGESAYRDAVLDYVSGRNDTMKVIPNRSYAAVNCFVGGICAWIGLLVLNAVQFQPLWLPILIHGLTETITGVMALITIRSKPRELKGLGLAMVGMVANVSAIVCAVILTMLKTR